MWFYYALSCLTTCLPRHVLFASMEAVRQLRLSRVKACRNWFWVHSPTNMIRVAAHKLGSISFSPQSDMVLTILTQPTDLQMLHALQLFHWLSNWHLFTWFLIHSILPSFQPIHTHAFNPQCPQWKHPRTLPLLWVKKSWCMHVVLSHTCNLLMEGMEAYRNPVMGENEVCVGSATLFLGVGKWARCVSDVIVRKHSQLWQTWGFSSVYVTNVHVFAQIRHEQLIRILTVDWTWLPSRFIGL